MTTSKVTGACQCGAIKYQSTSEPVFGAHCHCQDCKKTTGAGHLSAILVPKESFTFEGKTSTYITPSDSGNNLHRNFCPTCGSNIFIFSEHHDGYFILAGTLDDIEIFKPNAELYTKHRASWDHISDDVPAFEGMPPKE